MRPVAAARGRVYKPGASWLAGWSNRRKITFDNSLQAENLTNFPVMVKINSSRIDYAKTQNSGQDLRFTDSDGKTLLDYEIEVWNESGDSFAWVRVPQIDASSSTDSIYMYYGNAGASDAQNKTGVWRSEYKGVWHLSETGNGTAGEYKDSTSNANHGRGGNGATAGVPTSISAGKCGKCCSFDGGDWIQIPKHSSLYSSNVSVGAWVQWKKPTAYSDTYGHYIIADYQGSTWICSFALQSSGSSMGTANRATFFWEYSTTPFAQGTSTLSRDTWFHVVATWDGTTRRVYVNGAQEGTNTTAQSRNSTVGDTAIGRAGQTDGQYWDGYLDEVFVYAGAMSAAWIAATYKSQADTFCTFGAEQ